MTWWMTPPMKRVYVPSSLKGLPTYKRDAFRAFMDGLSPRLMKGTTVEVRD